MSARVMEGYLILGTLDCLGQEEGSFSQSPLLLLRHHPTTISLLGEDTTNWGHETGTTCSIGGVRAVKHNHGRRL